MSSEGYFRPDTQWKVSIFIEAPGDKQDSASDLCNLLLQVAKRFCGDQGTLERLDVRSLPRKRMSILKEQRFSSFIRKEDAGVEHDPDTAVDQPSLTPTHP